MRQHKDGAGYAPTFAFRDAVGTEHLVVTSVYSSPPEHRVGDSVGVLYLATDPKNARLEGFSYLWGLPTATGVIGAFNLLVGLGLLLWPRIAPQFGKQNA